MRSRHRAPQAQGAQGVSAAWIIATGAVLLASLGSVCICLLAAMLDKATRGEDEPRRGERE